MSFSPAEMKAAALRLTRGGAIVKPPLSETFAEADFHSLQEYKARGDSNERLCEIFHVTEAALKWALKRIQEREES